MGNDDHSSGPLLCLDLNSLIQMLCTHSKCIFKGLTYRTLVGNGLEGIGRNGLESIGKRWS